MQYETAFKIPASETASSQIYAQSKDVTSNQMLGDLQNIMTYLKDKGKLRNLGKGPKQGDSAFEAWDKAGSMVIS